MRLQLGNQRRIDNLGKAEVLNVFFASVFQSQSGCAPGPQPPETGDRLGLQNEAPRTQGETVNDLLHHLHTHKSMGSDGIRPRVLRELAKVITKPLCIIHQQSWLTGEVPLHGELANVMPIYKKGWKEGPGTCHSGLSAREGPGAQLPE